MPATTAPDVHLGTSAEIARPSAAAEHHHGRLNANGRTRTARWTTVLVDAVTLLGVVLSVPLAVLLVGTPIALTIVLLLWLGRLALSGF